MRMQKHALQTQLGDAAIQFEIPVFVVPGNGKTKVRKMHPNLMSAASFELGAQEAVTGPCLLQFKNCMEATQSKGNHVLQ